MTAPSAWKAALPAAPPPPSPRPAQTLAALTNLAHLELLSFSASVPRSSIALQHKSAREGSLRTAPWAGLGPALEGLTKLSHLMLSDQGFSPK